MLLSLSIINSELYLHWLRLDTEKSFNLKITTCITLGPFTFVRFFSGSLFLGRIRNLDQKSDLSPKLNLSVASLMFVSCMGVFCFLDVFWLFVMDFCFLNVCFFLFFLVWIFVVSWMFVIWLSDVSWKDL